MPVIIFYGGRKQGTLSSSVGDRKYFITITFHAIWNLRSKLPSGHLAYFNQNSLLVVSIDMAQLAFLRIPAHNFGTSALSRM